MMDRRQLLALSAGLVLTPAPALASQRTLRRAIYASELRGLSVGFFAVDLETGQRVLLEESQITRRHAPWSTFKIPNFVIALESGAVANADVALPWNRQAHPPATWWPKAWRQDQTLATAFQRSVPWAFQDIANRVGATTYRETLKRWSFGNAAAPDGSDSFWLGAPLAISIAEQVTFLSRLASGTLNVSAATLAALDQVSANGRFGANVVHAKTGAGTIESGNFKGAFEGWYVGYVKRDSKVRAAFALHCRGPSFSSIRSFRRDFSVRLLVASGLLSH